MNPLEALASLLGVANIVLLVRRSIWNYPVGLGMVTLYAVIFFRARLYSDTLLQGFFFALQIYGWWAWAQAGGDSGQPVRVERLSPAARLLWLASIAAFTLLWGAGMHRYTDAAAPWWDGTVAVMSVAAQIQLALRLVENWMLWIVVDILAIGLYLSKGLLLTAALYALFLVLAVVGLREWQAARAQRVPAA